MARAQQNARHSAALARVVAHRRAVECLSFRIPQSGRGINAGGRIGDAGLGARLLTLDDPNEAMRIAEELDRLNQERQAMETIMLEQAETEAMVELSAGAGPAVLVTASDDWHPGHRWAYCGAAKGAHAAPGFRHRLQRQWHGQRFRPVDQWLRPGKAGAKCG